MNDFWDHLYKSEDPAVQLALELRRTEVLQHTGQAPTWAEDVQFAVGFERGRRSR